jgi:hypothetical protein
MWPSDTRGYATPATPNAQWSRLTLCRYQNQLCVPSGYQFGYLLPYPTWENPKPQFWHFEPWFPKVLKIFENTLLYITVGQATLLAPGFWSPLCSSNPSIKMSVDVLDPNTWLVSHHGYPYLSLYLIMTLQKKSQFGTWKFTKRLSRSQF